MNQILKTKLAKAKLVDLASWPEKNVTDGDGNFFDSVEDYLSRTAKEDIQKELFCTRTIRFEPNAQDLLDNALDEFFQGAIITTN